MRRISRSVVFYKRVYPVLLFVVALAFTLEWYADVAFNGSDRALAEVLGAWMIATIGWVLAWFRTIGLADEVLDAGDYLLVRIGAKSGRVSITDIDSVTESVFTNLHRVELRLLWPGPLGHRIAFLPVLHHSLLNPFVKSRVHDDLTKRVERAR